MDYWNPNEGRINFTEFEIEHDFLHVTLNANRSKLIRKQVQTLKTDFFYQSETYPPQSLFTRLTG